MTMTNEMTVIVRLSPMMISMKWKRTIMKTASKMMRRMLTQNIALCLSRRKRTSMVVMVRRSKNVKLTNWMIIPCIIKSLLIFVTPGTYFLSYNLICECVFFFYIDTKFMLLCYSNNVLKCELVGYEAVNFYKSFKKWQYDVIICVIRWGVVDVFQDKRTITATECTQIRLNPGIPEVAEFRTSISRKRTRTSVPKKK
ncbi:uncharacterized protein LOC9316779 [Arabidopsis lyrata subsp. lyrata]|uniref:uncharacterized protein LOC9316779 n=1 Tax=Arabidopsis lyrata subsp. lyrata TaxID=81972 RepID=UPI000A29D159|nr:uncharacterized protein LOC9316779 [Arabidopsis lyrata subsp. lyrata]|eukprot:XP_020885035.1 uncharacterized protein LOC9316779 [Arabidopsis lyrata subsp. lyrata]